MADNNEFVGEIRMGLRDGSVYMELSQLPGALLELSPDVARRIGLSLIDHSNKAQAWVDEHFEDLLK